MMDLFLAAAAATFQPAVAPALEVHEDVLIHSVSDDPGVVFGIVASAIRISGIRDGATEDYFIFFLEPGQPRPAVGARCRIAFTHFPFQVHFVGQPNSAVGGRSVHDFRCEAGEGTETGR